MGPGQAERRGTGTESGPSISVVCVHRCVQYGVGDGVDALADPSCPCGEPAVDIVRHAQQQLFHRMDDITRA